jgi:hypothetical protein
MNWPLILSIPSVTNAETSDVHAADPTAGQGELKE